MLNVVKDKSLFGLVNSIAPFAAAAGILSFVAVTWFGVGKVAVSWACDFAWYFAGGRCFLTGSNMYAIECVGPMVTKVHGYSALAGLSYPPHFGPIAALVALLPIFYAKYVFFIANILASLAIVLILSNTVTRVFKDREQEMLSHKWALLLVMGSSGLWAAVWIGQIAVFIAVCLWVAFRELELGHDFMAAILLALASVKPQMAALVFLWLLLHGQFKTLFFASVVAGLLSLYTFTQMGVMPAIDGWLKGVTTYQNYPVNQLGNDTIMGLPSFLALIGIEIPLWIAMLFGAAIILALRIKSSVPPFSPMALSTILLVQMMIFSRFYDMILIAPVFALFWPSNRSDATKLIIFLGAIAIYCFPQQLVVKALPFAAAGHFRTLLLVALLIAFVRQMLLGFERFDDQAAKQPSASVQTV